MAVPPMVRMAAVHTPRLIGAMAFLSFLPARTTKTPTMVARMPMAGMAIGKITVLAASPLRWIDANAVTPRMMAAMMVMTYDSKRSAANPAQSHTLSPTLSAMVAALRGA